MKNLISFLALVLFFCHSALAQEVVYNNAHPADPTNPDIGLVTSPGSGCSGGDESVLQSVSLGMTTLGFGAQILNGFKIADDFTLDQSCDLQSIRFYSYQTGGTTTSSLTDIRVQIYDGPPNAGGTVIWGDETTNRMTATDFSGIYRSTETTMGSCNRAIHYIDAEVSTTLAAGTYWVEYSIGGTLPSGPWLPPLTVLGSNTTGNALQFTGTWNFANDGATFTQQGFPFLITAASKADANIPTLGEWGIMLLGLLFVTVGLVALRALPAMSMSKNH